MTTAQPLPRPVGELLRQWRERRRLSQLDLALQAEISTRHLSFLETGRSRPSRDMLLRLAEQLEVPLRERNHLLLAGGYAPAFGQAALDAPQMAAVRAALRQVLTGHEPYPAVVVDRGLEPGRRQRRRGRARRPGRAGAARSPGQRAPGQPAPRRDGPADRQPGRVAGPPVRPAPPPDRPHRRPRAGRAVPGAARLPLRPARAGGRGARAGRRGRPAAAAPRRPGAVVPEHHGQLRDPAGRDRRRAGHRVVLPRRPRDRVGPPRPGRPAALPVSGAPGRLAASRRGRPA